MRVYINYNTHTELTREPDSSDSWDRGSTSSSHEILGLVLNSNDCSFLSERLDIDFDVHAGENYYLLYAVYDTGDSFGHDDDRGIEFIDLFKSEEKADKAYEVICRDSKQPRIYIETETGKTHNFYAPWNGYFESLSYVEVKPVSLLMYKRKNF